jgi:hypothetical protein
MKFSNVTVNYDSWPYAPERNRAVSSIVTID